MTLKNSTYKVPRLKFSKPPTERQIEAAIKTLDRWQRSLAGGVVTRLSVAAAVHVESLIALHKTTLRKP